MYTPLANSHPGEGISRRALLQTSLAAGLTLSALPLSRPATLWGAEAGPPKRGGILRVRGYDPTHFDPHLTISFKTHATLSFVHSRLVRHKVGAGVQPGIFTVEPDVAESWETPDDTTYIFHLRQGVKWSSKTGRPVWRCTAPGKSTAGHGTGGVCVNRIWRHSRRARRIWCTRITCPMCLA